MTKISGLHLPSTAQGSEKNTSLLKITNIGVVFKTTTTLHHPIKPIAPTRLQEHEKVEYTKLRARPATKLMSGRQVET